MQHAATVLYVDITWLPPRRMERSGHGTPCQAWAPHGGHVAAAEARRCTLPDSCWCVAVLGNEPLRGVSVANLQQ